MKYIASYTTGSRRGYIHVCYRCVSSEIEPIPESLKGYRGNLRRALEYLRSKGCTHYSVYDDQGIPSTGVWDTNNFCHSVYKGYVAE